MVPHVWILELHFVPNFHNFAARTEEYFLSKGSVQSLSNKNPFSWHLPEASALPVNRVWESKGFWLTDTQIPLEAVDRIVVFQRTKLSSAFQKLKWKHFISLSLKKMSAIEFLPLQSCFLPTPHTCTPVNPLRQQQQGRKQSQGKDIIRTFSEVTSWERSESDFGPSDAQDLKIWTKVKKINK